MTRDFSVNDTFYPYHNPSPLLQMHLELFSSVCHIIYSTLSQISTIMGRKNSSDSTRSGGGLVTKSLFQLSGTTACHKPIAHAEILRYHNEAIPSNVRSHGKVSIDFLFDAIAIPGTFTGMKVNNHLKYCHLPSNTSNKIRYNVFLPNFFSMRVK